MTCVLVVEDQPMNLRLLETILTSNGYTFVGAESGEEGVKAARSMDVDLVLMDLQMPGINGFEALDRIRAIPGKENLPVIAVTGNTTGADQDRVTNAGFSAFVSKPFKIDDLLETLSFVLEREQQRGG